MAKPWEKSITSSSVPWMTRTGDATFETLSMLKHMKKSYQTSKSMPLTDIFLSSALQACEFIDFVLIAAQHLIHFTTYSGQAVKLRQEETGWHVKQHLKWSTTVSLSVVVIPQKTVVGTNISEILISILQLIC